MYYIYHIPGVKIGCTDNVEERMKSQKVSIYEVLEEHLDIYIASNREIELQKQYGYPVDKRKYYEVLSMCTYKARSKGGKKAGVTHIKSGHISTLGKNSVLLKTGWMAHDKKVLGGKIGGAISGSIERVCQYCNKKGKGANHFRYHGDRCKAKPQ